MADPVTPLNVVYLARVASGIAMLILPVLMLGPFQGLESAFGLSDKAAHLIAFYILTVLSFVVAPGRRRTDLAIMVLSFGVAIEAVQALTGRTLSLTDLLANGCGILAALLPGEVERLRVHARTNPYMSFSDIKRMDRRRRRTASVEGVLPELEIPPSAAPRAPNR